MEAPVVALGEPQRQGLRGELQSLWLLKERALHALYVCPELAKPLSQFQRSGHHSVEMVSPMRDAPDGKGARGDDESIGAHCSKQSQPNFVGRSAIVRV